MNILSRLRLIRSFVFDMDGVLTDGGLLVHGDGQWIRRMDIKDGFALQVAVQSGFRVVVVSGSASDQVAARLAKLGVTEVFMGIADKSTFLAGYLERHGIDRGEVLFMGDDLPDYGCMKLAGVACCPADAVAEIREAASFISAKKGGYGCVRDVIEQVLKLNQSWPLHTSVAAT